MKKRLSLSTEQRREWVNKWRSSGLSGGQFARRHGLNESTLYRWGQRMAEGGAVSLAQSRHERSAPPSFAEVRIGARNDSEGSIEVTLGHGRVVRVSGRVERAQLELVFQALQSC